MGKGLGFSRGLLAAMVGFFASFNQQKGELPFFPRQMFREGTRPRLRKGRVNRASWTRGNKLARAIDRGLFTKNQIR